MKTRHKIAMHTASGFLWLPVGALLGWGLHAPLPVMLLVMVAFALVHRYFAPRCPACGTDVYRVKTRWFGEGYSGFTVRCSQCGLVWSKE